MENSNNYRDPLLDCLLYIAHSKHIHCTESGLIADLPLVDGRLSPELALRCCERLGIEAKVVSRALSEIPAEVLPAILVGKENSAMVLMGLEQEAQQAKVYDGERGLYRLPISAVNEKYSGYAIFLSQNIENISQDLADLGLGGSPSDHWFWSTIKQSWRIYRDVLVASFFINIFALAMPLFVMNVYDRVVPNDAIETLWVLSLGVLLVASFDFILKTLRVYFIEIAGKKSDILLSSFIFSRVMGAKFKYHPKSSGVFANQLREFESVRTFITSAAVTTIVDLPFALLFFLIIAYIGGQIIWVAVIAAPVLLAYAWWVQKRLSETVSHSLAASANKNSTLVDAMVGLETLKSLGAEGRALHRWEQSSGRLAYWGLKSRIYSSSATNVAALILQLASVSVVVVGVYSISDRALTMGALVASVMLVGRALSPMVGIANLLVQYQQAKLAFLSLSEIVKKPQERPSGRSFIQREELEGAVEFKEVSFSYPEEKIAALTNVSFAVKPGEKLAVIGKLGSGKSSLQRLIMRLHEPSIGNILLDGTDVAQMDPADVRKNIGYVPQDSLLFSGTIRENIAYRNIWVSDADVLNAVEIAGVTAFTSHHPLGLERQVGERGEALSGGQRQAICLARALALRPNILLLDEPTSAMDNSTESTIVNKLKTYCEHRTLILVTHRTSLLQLVDRIIVLEDGKLVADGPREFVVDALKKGQLRVS